MRLNIFYEKKLGLINLSITHNDHSKANAIATQMILLLPHATSHHAICTPQNTIIPNPPIITNVIKILVKALRTFTGAADAVLIIRHLGLSLGPINGTSVLRKIHLLSLHLQ